MQCRSSQRPRTTGRLEGGRVGASTTGSLQADANLTLSYPPSSDMPAACLHLDGGNFSNISLKNVLPPFLTYIILPWHASVNISTSFVSFVRLHAIRTTLHPYMFLFCCIHTVLQYILLAPQLLKVLWENKLSRIQSLQSNPVDLKLLSCGATASLMVLFT